MASAWRAWGVVTRRAVLGFLPALALIDLPRPVCAQTGAPAEDDRKLLAILGQLVIPPVADAGADQTAVVDFVTRALAHGLDEASPGTLPELRHALDAAARGDFTRQDAATQLAALTTIDAAAYTSLQPSALAWRKVKGLILAGYYNSEVGATKELAYELAPGRWDNDIPFKPGDRAIANDWFAVSFR